MAGTGVFAEILDGDVFKYYSEGEWEKSSSGKSVAIINPNTRKTQYKVQGTQISHIYMNSQEFDFHLLLSFAFFSHREVFIYFFIFIYGEETADPPYGWSLV